MTMCAARRSERILRESLHFLQRDDPLSIFLPTARYFFRVVNDILSRRRAARIMNDYWEVVF